MTLDKKTQTSKEKIPLDNNPELKDYVDNNPELFRIYELFSNIPEKSTNSLNFTYILDKNIGITDKTTSQLGEFKKKL